MHKGVLRRTLVIGLWPFTDFIVTVVANVMLVNSGVVRAIVVTTIVGTLLNVLFLHLLSFEHELIDWVQKQTNKLLFVRLHKVSLKVGKTFAVLLAYAVSGPAMVGAPIIWFLGIRGRKAYLLATLGITINSIIWVGGIYHLFWTLVKTVISRGISLL